ncbi:hypothetical protein DT304_03560 [Lactobacillus reuteri]|uniref:restriction endonuclease subunit S n=2 Tax=Limosilactobacillus reuteri TaxID=1598 RepID=UPI001651B300|nr:restriction endonuclease subunit S [Limosilactobacillus reuteri]MBC6910362.1 hypothetical protein [Limosilactobacillus reuteri]
MDKKPERLVPEVRFKGFTDDWEQRKLGTLFQKNIERNDDEKFNYNQTLSVSTMTFKPNGNGASAKSLANYKVLRLGDVAFEGHPNKQFSYGRFVVNDNADGIMSPRFATIRPIKAININYWKNYLHNENIMKYVLVKSTKAGTMMNELVYSDLYKQVLKVPNITEQVKIGNLLQKIEIIITLQQRKLEQLKLLKKAILQIIASNGFLLHTKKVDMIKVRVADIYQITRGNVLARSEISNVQTSKYPYPVYSSQTKNLGLMGYYKDFLFKNAITWTTDGANAGTVKYRKGRFYSTNVNGVLLSSEGLANQLTAELLNLVAFKYVSHVGNPKLMNNTMGEIMFNIPESIETQQYFSNCIELVINLIGKQEKAIDKLNKLKKYLLQELFI